MNSNVPLSQTATKKAIDGWKIVAIVILILAVVSRFYMLGVRAVSHDETTHAKYAWNFYTGRGFRHDPLMHGPLLFEVSAFFYFLFGVSDFTARLYTALTGIALVMMPLLFRKWLGNLGAMLASGMLLISPAISYYSRYTRHDVPVILYAALFLWAILRYLDEGKPRWLYGMVAFFPLMYASKENAYIYTAIFLGLLALLFAWQVFTIKWARQQLFSVLAIVLLAALLLGAVFAFSFRSATVVMYTPEGSDRADEVHVTPPWWGRVALALAMLSALGTVVIIYYGVGEVVMRDMRLFDVLMTLGTFTLPLGSALFINYVVGADMKVFYDALNTANLSTLPVAVIIGAGAVLLVTLGVSIALGLWWNSARWPTLALVYYAIFFVLFSSIFTHGWGMFTGLIGGLAYWMAQQGVQRGTQPWYYYGVIGPLYEYLPLLFSIPAGVGAVVYVFKSRGEETRNKNQESGVESQESGIEDRDSLLPTPYSLLLLRLFPIFLLAWCILSWGAYIYAGEKMPWLFTHIAFPHILLAAWGLGRWLKDVTWDDIVAQRGWILMAALFFLWRAFGAYQKSTEAIQQMFFSGDQAVETGLKLTLEKLQPLGTIVGVFGGVLLFGGLVVWAFERAGLKRALRLTLLAFTGVVAVYTLRTMIMLNYINYALPKEYMVYAHATPDVKVVLEQIEEISWRTTGTPRDIKVGYSKEVLWPFMWYMDTQYPNGYYFADSPQEEQLLECPVVLAASTEWSTVEAILGDAYRSFDYKYIWWPIEDYKDLTGERIRTALFDSNWRAALRDVILNRDYTLYAKLRNPEAPFTLKTWPHRLDFRFYVRRDIAQEVWRYHLGGTGVLDDPHPQATQMPDPYSTGEQSLAVAARATLPDVMGRGLAAAPDGAFYVADSAHHRVWHITAQGSVLDAWGDQGTEVGQFNEPWGVAVDTQGNVYVADTWNHRIQKFDAQGRAVLSWGRFAQMPAFAPSGQGAFYGPRGIAIAPESTAGAGNVYVTDTGNKRVQVFDADGNFLFEFGGAGDALGQMNEPVGIAVSEDGLVFVADTWNRRVQIFTTDGLFVSAWDIPVWGSENPEEKPFLTWAEGFVYVGDPVHQRVLVFTEDGAFEWALREAGGLLFPEGLAVIGDTLYVTDAHTGQMVGYRLP